MRVSVACFRCFLRCVFRSAPSRCRRPRDFVIGPAAASGVSPQLHVMGLLRVRALGVSVPALSPSPNGPMPDRCRSSWHTLACGHLEGKKAQGALAGALSHSTGLSAVEVRGSAVVVQTSGFHTPTCSRVSSPGTFPAPLGACCGCPARSVPVDREERCAWVFCAATAQFWRFWSRGSRSRLRGLAVMTGSLSSVQPFRERSRP